MKRILPLLLLAPILGVAALVGTVAAIDARAGYRSPLAGPEPPAPREDALRELARWRKEKAKEEVRIAELMANLDTGKMVELGKEIVHGRGLCFNCHRVGSEGKGTQGPDLAGVGGRAGERVEHMSSLEYLTQSLYEPGAYIVEGYTGAMTPADRPPIGLSELDVKMVIAYLQSLGGEPTITPDTNLPR